MVFLSTVKDVPNRPLPEEHWKDLRAQIDRVLRGERPLPGPPNQMPIEVRNAIARVDSALEQGDADGARRAMELARFTVTRWVGAIPASPAMQLERVRALQEEWPSDMFNAPVDKLRPAWKHAKDRLKLE